MMAKLVDLVIGALIKYLLNYVEKVLPQVVKEWKRKKEQELAQAAAKQKLDEVVANPNSTVEERTKAYENFINSGN